MAERLPITSPQFHWTHETWGAALRCYALDRLATHLFSTRQLELSVQSGWDILGISLGIEPGRVRRLKQVHGRGVVVLRPDTEWSDETPPAADALVTDDGSVVLAVVAADCVPLLMTDRTRGVVAAVHAGWRGTAAGIATAVVDAMHEHFGSRPADILAVLGPSIGPCCYEVGPELVDAFAAAGHERSLIDRWFLSPPPPRGSTQRQSLRLDVPGANRDQLVLAGVPVEQIHLSSLCTATNLGVLTSFRKERERATRIVGAIRASG